MRLESQRLEKQINSLHSQIETFPEGKLVCTQSNNHYFKWYRSDGHNSVYIPRKQRNLAEQLAIKKYLSLVIEDLEHEKKAIDFYLRHLAPSKAEIMLSDEAAYQELLSPFFKPQSQRLCDWMKSPYDYSTKYPEHKIYKTSSGNLVRSKSEALIDMVLSVNKIPFRYECALQLGENMIYPDFTIKHPQTEVTYYWEHFGKMDDSKYAKNAGEKIQLYISQGIIPSINLITTYETAEMPLDTEKIEKIVEEYFG